MLLRQVAADIGMDTAILSKIERSERYPTRQQLLQLADFYSINTKQLLVEWYSFKITRELRAEPLAIDILNRSIRELKSVKLQ